MRWAFGPPEWFEKKRREAKPRAEFIEHLVGEPKAHRKGGGKAANASGIAFSDPTYAQQLLLGRDEFDFLDLQQLVN